MARRVFTWLLPVFAVVTVPVQAGPGDLPKQAIEETGSTSSPNAEKIKELVDRADTLIEQREFGEAIALYERAYRLAPTDQSNYVRLLVAKRAAGRITSEERTALELIREQQSSRIDQTFRRVRLDVLQARQALRAGDVALAMSMLQHGEAALDRLPTYVDDGPYRRRLTALRKVIRRKEKKLEKHAEKKRNTGSPHDPAKQDAPDRTALTDGRTLSLTEVADGSQPSPSGEIVNVDALLAQSMDRHAYDRELTRALRKNRVARLLSSNEAAFAPETDMSLPDDWPERTARRAAYRDGVIYRGEPFTGADGKTYTTVIYDLGDLVHPVPNFYASYPGTVRRQRMELLDRHFLRDRSQIFNGYPEDLAAGLPLLHFFGGIDNNAVSTRTDPRETERIVNIIERFINEP